MSQDLPTRARACGPRARAWRGPGLGRALRHGFGASALKGMRVPMPTARGAFEPRTWEPSPVANPIIGQATLVAGARRSRTARGRAGGAHGGASGRAGAHGRTCGRRRWARAGGCPESPTVGPTSPQTSTKCGPMSKTGLECQNWQGAQWAGAPNWLDPAIGQPDALCWWRARGGTGGRARAGGRAQTARGRCVGGRADGARGRASGRARVGRVCAHRRVPGIEQSRPDFARLRPKIRPKLARSRAEFAPKFDKAWSNIFDTTCGPTSGKFGPSLTNGVTDSAQSAPIVATFGPNSAKFGLGSTRIHLKARV